MSVPPANSFIYPPRSHRILDEKEKQKNSVNLNKILRDTFTCPLSLGKKIMKKPSVLTCGHSFEDNAIREHLTKSEKCPKCEKTSDGTVVPNTSLQQTIEAWQNAGHGDYATTESWSF